MDTQLVMRPLLDKIEVKTTATAFRKIHFPHVSFNILKLFNLHLQLNVTQTVLKRIDFFFFFFCHVAEFSVLRKENWSSAVPVPNTSGSVETRGERWYR